MSFFRNIITNMIWTPKDFSDLSWNFPSVFVPLVNIKTETHITKPIDGYEDYTISTNGDVTSYKRSKVGKVMTNSNNGKYLYVPLTNDEGKKNQTIHRLIAKAFIPNPDNKPCVNHIDADKTNNSVTNLEWCTSSENNQHAQDLGLNRGNLKHSHLLPMIVSLTKVGMSQRAIGKVLGCSHRTVGNYINKQKSI